MQRFPPYLATPFNNFVSILINRGQGKTHHTESVTTLTICVPEVNVQSPAPNREAIIACIEYDEVSQVS